MNVLVTGGCGFIGSNLVKYLRKNRFLWKVVNLNKLTYAGNLENLKDLESDPQHVGPIDIPPMLLPPKE